MKFKLHTYIQNSNCSLKQIISKRVLAYYTVKLFRFHIGGKLIADIQSRHMYRISSL